MELKKLFQLQIKNPGVQFDSSNLEAEREALLSNSMESITSHDYEEVRVNVDRDQVRNNPAATFRKNARILRIMAAKSRLIDPPGVLRKDEIKNHRDGDVEISAEDIPEEYKKMNLSATTILQWVSLLLIVTSLICSLAIPVYRKQTFWDLQLWKWETMILILICGRLVSGWGIRVIVFIIERSYLFRKRVLYFVYGLRRAVQNCIWLAMVLIAWQCIFDHRVEKESKTLAYITKILICLLVGTVIWLIKTLLVKVLALSFHVNTFFDRIHESVFNQYVIETLMSEAMLEQQSADESGKKDSTLLQTRSIRVIGEDLGKKSSKLKQEERISIEHLHRMSPTNISAWNMKRLINTIKHGALSTLDEQILESDITADSSMQMRSECQANETAKKMHRNVAKPGSECIYLDDLMRFMEENEAVKTMQLIGTSECEGISQPLLKNWVVKFYRERKALALSLNDTKTSIDELHIILNILVTIIILVVSLIIMEVRITHFLVFISSQVVLAAFIFGNTCKTIFEAIIFLFVMHPFDVGDRCEVDGVQLIVEEMNILTTVFLKADYQKIIYPNSVLATKPISNYYRSPHMGDSIEFCIHISTPTDKINTFKDKMKRYIDGKGEHWYPNPVIIIMDVEEMNKLKMVLWCRHRMNHQNMLERWIRRNLLIDEIIKVFKELDIEYRLLPRDVNVRYMASLDSSRPPSNWTICTG